MPLLTGILTALLLVAPAALAREAQSGRERLDWPPVMALDHVLVQAGLYTTHFSDDPDHTNDQRLFGLELHNPDRWFVGGARFRNSFSQTSHYLYAGRELPLWRTDDVTLRAKLTAGLLHGYHGEYRDKIPFNQLGVAPAILPTVGIQWHRFESDLIVFGTAGMMVTAGVRF